MSNTVKITVPDIGGFEEVEVIDVLVSAGDRVTAEQSLITLESDKASMDVPTPVPGTVEKVLVSVGDKVSEGSPILLLAAEQTESTDTRPAKPEAATSRDESAAENQGVFEFERATSMDPDPPTEPMEADRHAEVLVLGAGPGGYTAAFRAADLGKKVVLVERYPALGGVCLNVGCIPSKALLHTAAVISEARDMAKHGVSFGAPKIDLDALRGWKDSVVGKLTRGLSALAKQRKVEVIQGRGEFIGGNNIVVDTPDGELTLSFDQAIIAAGSRVAFPPGFDEHPRILDSTSALALKEIPGKMLVVGGGIIGLEMATVYQELGSKVTVVELTPSLLPGVDKDLVKPLQKRIQGLYEDIHVNTKITELKPTDEHVAVKFEGPADAPADGIFDYVLVATGRRPNGHVIGAENAGVRVNDQGFIEVDNQQRTNVPHIFAIGDIVGQPMLAHKATHEGKVAAEVCAGHKSYFDARVIPSVAYTDPEVAWVGVTETEAKSQKLDYGKGVFPWAASGRALGLDRDEGLTKLLFDKTSGRVIGAGIVGPHAGDLIAEAALAIEMQCDMEDIGLTIHPHPTLSETVAFAAEAFAGTITDLYMPKR